MGNVIEMCGISKAFGSTQANDGVDFACRAGEVLCLLGENGAGKTTLMKILYGMYRPDAGTISLDGERVSIKSPRDAIRRGIQMVHQHFMLVGPLSVTDNVMIGKEVKSHGLYDRKAAAEKVRALSGEYGLKVPPEKLVRELSVGEQQRVEIIKALYQGARVLILDEPTAVLTPQEVEELFDVINRLRESGKSVIMITHKLKETMAISDRVYVMRQGRMVGQRKTGETSIDELSEMMVGHQVARADRVDSEPGEVILRMEHVALKRKDGGEPLRDVTLEVRRGEILGICGVEGNGQMELAGVLTATAPGWRGEIWYKGKPIRHTPTAGLLAGGISCIQADRQRDGIAMSLDVPHNLMMGYQQTGIFRKHGLLVDWKKIQAASAGVMEEYDVRPPEPRRALGEFSGGNQQKFVVGREMMRRPDLMIAAHPTRGVDIQATAFIHGRLLDLKAQGAGVLLITADLDELLQLSDRVAVIYDGRIVGCKKAGEYQLMELGRLMGGGQSDA
ncbi:MAG: ABC transporter ATP-binding protein [Lachnospiraceae bacterium]|nr:ABC transporter ATP-binding protein [Lachnospiraceae bacterium]